VTADRWVGAVAVSGMLLTACAHTEAAAGGGGQLNLTLRVAIGVEPDTLDPKRQTTTTVMNVVQMMVESLVTLDADGRIQPGLATEWQEEPDSWRRPGRAVPGCASQGVLRRSGAGLERRTLDLPVGREVPDRLLIAGRRCGLHPERVLLHGVRAPCVTIGARG
jgi:hypothetical protein